MSAPIPILMYHAVAEHPMAATRRLSVRPEILAAQLALLRREGFTTLTFSRLVAALRRGGDLPARAIVLTFDDGYADFHRDALPLLVEHGAVATVFITTGWVHDARERAGTPPDRMLSWRQIDEVSATVEIGAHSHTHAQLDQLSNVALQRELSLSKTLLEDRLGKEVPALAYPYGYSSARVRAAVRAAGYQHAAAVSNAATRPHDDLLALPRLTIKRSTNLNSFKQIIHCDDIPKIFLVDRTLTAGWAAVRRTQYALGKVRGDD
jgi:peptidoglycan/xylan/chitin deacetylase (PgdA/CDA1 family)